MRTWMTTTAALFAAGCVATSAARRTGRIEATLLGARKGQDKVTTVRVDGTTVIDVRSGSGIGIAELAVKDGTWPKPLVVRLHLRGMEMFSVSTAQLRLSAAIPSSAPEKTIVEMADLQRRTVIQVKRSSSYWMPVRIVDNGGDKTRQVPVNDGYIEVTIPEAVHDYGADKLVIQWIDFYR